MQPRFEGFQAFEEGEQHQPYAQRGLVPILGRNAELFRKGDRSKQVTHDGLSSYLMSAFLPQNGSGVSKIYGNELNHTLPIL